MSRNKKQERLSRNITLGEITEESANDVIWLIYEINKEDANKQTDTREPIHIILNSVGGNIYDGFAIVDAMMISKTPIHITVLGKAMSMALLIVTCSDYARTTKHTTFMYHDSNYDLSGKTSFHKQEIKEVDRMDSLYDELLISTTKLTKKQLDQVKKERKEWYITADQALKFGIVDEII